MFSGKSALRDSRAIATGSLFITIADTHYRFFWKYDINVCRIESRPIQGVSGGQRRFDFFGTSLSFMCL
jgi:hypothetical protein